MTPTKNARSRMVSEQAIREYWAQHVERFPQYDSGVELLEAGVCMACGMAAKCERAHIIPLCTGGANTADNLHMLCGWCHKASEGLSGSEYWAWLQRRSVADVAIQVAAARGVNVWDCLQMERTR